MKYQQRVSVDLVNMVYTALAYLALAGAAWLFLRLIQACFWLPGHMKRQNDLQRILQEKVDAYERYMEECDAKEAAGDVKDDEDGRSLEEKRKERRECLDMLKRELNRIRDGGDPYDFDFFKEQDEKLMEECQKYIEEVDEEDAERDTEREKQNSDLEENEKTVVDEKDALLMQEPKKTK